MIINEKNKERIGAKNEKTLRGIFARCHFLGSYRVNRFFWGGGGNKTIVLQKNNILEEIKLKKVEF